MNIKKDALVEMMRKMILIRRTEEKIAELYHKQKIKCPVHLSLGQEACAVGICANLSEKDYVFSNHRCHAHYLAKGGDLNAMIAELYGKETGCTGGWGGSMHLVDHKAGLMGSSSIVAGSISIAVGTALAFKMKKEERIAVVFFGDGAAEEGVFYESMNFASLMNLPVLFVCENNFIAVETHIAMRQLDNISERGNVFGIAGVRVDGQNIVEVYEAANEAVGLCRNGNRPVLIECRTERWAKHVSPVYKKTENCPIERFNEYLCKNSFYNLGGLMIECQKEADEKLIQAFRFAEESPDPVFKTKKEK